MIDDDDDHHDDDHDHDHDDHDDDEDEERERKRTSAIGPGFLSPERAVQSPTESTTPKRAMKEK